MQEGPEPQRGWPDDRIQTIPEHLDPSCLLSGTFLSPEEDSVSKVEMVTPMALIYQVLFSSISTFETPPCAGTWPLFVR
jgi:hypothetical protein